LSPDGPQAALRRDSQLKPPDESKFINISARRTGVVLLCCRVNRVQLVARNFQFNLLVKFLTVTMSRDNKEKGAAGESQASRDSYSTVLIREKMCDLVLVLEDKRLAYCLALISL